MLALGTSRREFLRIGALGMGGLGWPQLLASRTAASPSTRPPIRSCIQLFMWGGPSQLETFDLKPNAPAGIRGEFQPIATSVPGLRIGEHLPRLAQRAHNYAVVRSMTHTGVNHGTSAYHMLTGHIHFTPGTLRHPTPNDYPSLGVAVSRFARVRSDLPGYVSLPSVLLDGDGGEVPGQGPGLLGQRHAPFYVNADPAAADFSLEKVGLGANAALDRLPPRRRLQSVLDQEGDRLAQLPATQAMGSHYDRAFRLLESQAVRRAFDLQHEPAGVRECFGRNTFGQSCLLARRLAEAGVPLITVYWNSPSLTTDLSWDTHVNSFERLRRHLLPRFDQTMSALVDDLHDRGLLDETLVVWMGEFGRTPRINSSVGSLGGFALRIAPQSRIPAPH